MVPAKPTAHRRWRQYRLRTVLLLILVCAAASAWLRQRELARLEREAAQLRADRAAALAAFESDGATLEFATASSGDAAKAVAQPAAGRTLLVALHYRGPLEAHAWQYNRFRGHTTRLGSLYTGWPYPSLPRVALFPELERLSVVASAELPNAELAGLQHLKQLKQLHVSGRLTEEGCRYLSGLTQLRELRIRRGKLGGSTLRNLLRMKQLEVLELADCELSDADLAYLADFTSLTTLDLSDNHISDAGVQRLSGLTELRALRLNGAAVTGEGLRALNRLKRLRRLDLTATEVDDLRHLVDLPALQLVVIQGMPLSDDAEEAFCNARPSVHVERNFGEFHPTHEGVNFWLQRRQRADGSWNLAEEGEVGLEPARATALSLLMHVAQGLSHRVRGHSAHDERERALLQGAIGWLLAWQDEHGRFGQRGTPGRRLETQAIAVLALSELGWELEDERIVAAGRRGAEALAADWLQLDARGALDRGELPGPGWLATAFASAGCGAVPEAATRKLWRLLDELAIEDGSRYGYDGRTADPGLTAEALVARRLFGWSKRDPRLARGITYLLEHLPDAADDPRYWFFGAQALHHVPGDAFDTWNRPLRSLLLEQQCLHGRHRGSYPPAPAASPRSRLEATCLTALSGQVYYRFLLLWQRR